MTMELINPPGSEAAYQAFQFSQAVKVGETVHVSGQVGYGPAGIPEGKEDQCRLAFGHLKAVLASAGANMSDIVSMTSYHTDPSDFESFKKVQREFIPENFPAHTAVGVTALLMPGLKCEISAVAVIGGARKS
ncbi:MAG: RidA family protein [Phenylobacterium sp.]|uniref:RidA family protein n=1 Tax=Phenylobacterium sp. TaxID=1871053 RepID=UPI002735E568|nr:RidA family protein [Phenylobacterium sp.]MDP3749607.1 RidA family protein [Phenylobacterium sp.]